VQLASTQAIVGRNNAGKSNLLKAIQLFMEASKRLLSEDSFHNQNMSAPIIIRITFTDLDEKEKAHFAKWMYDDERLIVERRFSEEEGEFNIDRVAILQEPEPEWLRRAEISGKNIKEWWKKKDRLRVGELNFADVLGTSRPLVGEWEEKAEQFVEQHGDSIPFTDVEDVNPRGFKTLLREGLPEYIHVSAVSDVTDEAKITKSSPFGRLINSTLNQVEKHKMQEVTKRIDELGKLLNRGDDRLPAIDDVENDLNALMKELNDIDVEIEINVPELEDLLGGSQIYAHDNTRTSIEDKGHGLQRSMVFTILRAYSMLVSQRDEDGTDSKSTIFGFEEPEIYQHPQSQRTLLSVFRDLSDNGDQVIYTTHSSHFVSVGHFDEVCIMRKVETDGTICTKPKQLSMDGMLEDLRQRHGIDGSAEGIRNQYANVFDVEIGEGFFADKVVLVEGRSEKYILPVYARLLDYDLDRANVAVVRAGGKGALDRLLRIFSGLRIPTYLIFDGDKSNNDNSVKDKTLELLELMGNPLDTIENVETVIDDNYAVWEETLEHVMRQEINNFESQWEATSNKWGPAGKALRHKFVALQLEQQVRDGSHAAEVVPTSIQEVIQKIQNLSSAVDVLASA
jgi:predicted ATP-dependent endonuclease of OLD family